MAQRPSEMDEQFWRDFLENGGDTWKGIGRQVMRRIPADPRCRMCASPFAGPGAPLMRLIGKRQSESNPNWCTTCTDFLAKHNGGAEVTTAMLFAIGLVGLFTIGGISGIMHSSPPADLQQTDSYFIVAHFHYVLFGGSMMGIFAGIYYYFPKITGRLMNEKLGKVHFWLTFIGMNLTFFPMHYAGLTGMAITSGPARESPQSAARRL